MRHTRNHTLFFLLVSILCGIYTNAQFGGTTPAMPGLDTAIMRRDTAIISVDPDPTNNPFLQSSGTVRTTDDPGGPGSGGGFGSPPPDAVIPIDGGVGFLVAGGALFAAGRYRRKKSKH
ncbi:MAG: hypothetical protein K2X37_13890 [Chitinophagaceae bacterium]|nr:hypothetical protein [Chitinophagaceae bacterium]